MPPRTINVSEARRDLPKLVRQVARGTGVVTIGPRGKPAAVLLGSEQYEAIRARAEAAPGPSGWERLRLELVGTPEELQSDLRAIRSEVDPTPPRPRARRAARR